MICTQITINTQITTTTLSDKPKQRMTTQISLSINIYNKHNILFIMNYLNWKICIVF